MSKKIASGVGEFQISPVSPVSPTAIAVSIPFPTIPQFTAKDLHLISLTLSLAILEANYNKDAELVAGLGEIQAKTVAMMRIVPAGEQL